MLLSIEFYNQLRSAIRVSDIVRNKVILTRKGHEYTGVCPFHDEKTPSFSVNDSKKFYHCFGCGAHGDVIRFVAETEGMRYRDAAIKVAQDHNIPLPTISPEQGRIYEEADRLHNILDLANQYFIANLSPEIRKYLSNRGIADQTIKDFGIGYAPGNGALEKFFTQKMIPVKDLVKSGLFGKRDDGKIYEIFNKRVMFPIKNFYSKIVGFGGRAIGEGIMPKYINSPETPIFKKSEVMFGENTATSFSYKDNYAILVEGYMDVIALHQANFKQAVASLGTAVTEAHMQKLWRICDEIIICLDGDNAGMRASSRIINLALPHITAEKSVSFIKLPTGLDPDDLIKSQGRAGFNTALINRVGLSEMIWETETQGKEFKTPEFRAALEKKFETYCALINDSSLKINYKRYFKDMLWQNIFTRKKGGIKQENNSNGILFSVPSYTEIEFVEKAICALLLKFPDSFIEIVETTKLCDFKLNQLKDLIE